MPQMSPMNWIIISISFLVLILFMTSILKGKNMKTHENKIENKNLLWKW